MSGGQNSDSNTVRCITCSRTVKTIKHNTTYTRNTKEKQKKTALANTTI